MMKTLVASLLLACSWVSYGQTPPETIKTELLTLSINGEVNGLFYKNGKGAQRLQASSGSISSPIFYEGPRVISLYKKAADLNPVPEGVTPPKPLHQVKIPEGTNRTLLLFAFTGKPEDPPKVRAYGITDSNFSEGDYRIYNFSTQNAYVMHNDDKVAVPSGKQGAVRGAKWGKKVQDMKVMLGKEEEGKLVPVYSSIWGHRPERRNFIFVFDQPGNKRKFNIKKFFDLPAYKSGAGQVVGEAESDGFKD